MLEQLTFCSDVFLEKDEFFYLVDLQEGMLVHAAAIKKALSYLIKKNIFREIGLSINQGVDGKWLHILKITCGYLVVFFINFLYWWH